MMLPRTFIVAAALLLAGCASAPPPHRLQFVDLTDDFARFCDSTASMEENERSAGRRTLR